MNLLIIHNQAEYIKNMLEPEFQELSISAVQSEEQARNDTENADILIAMRSSDDLMKRAVNLKWIQSMIAGVNFFLELPSLRKEILITSASGIHGPQMSEMAILLMLSLNRKLPKVFENKKNRIWERWPGQLLFHKIVGILGVGAIGQEIAKKCKAFDMTVLGIDAVKRELDYMDRFYDPDELSEVMRVVDYFISVVPSTPQTRKMLGIKEFSTMKTTAFFINMGRGDTIDEEALIDVLNNNKIAGAALDVFSKEPLPKDSPLWDMENVIITPHIGGESDIYVDQALPIIKENLRRYINGERRDLINFIER
jgi:D-2-hydroxyacid dehydrogenase (NADP+)